MPGLDPILNYGTARVQGVSESHYEATLLFGSCAQVPDVWAALEVDDVTGSAGKSSERVCRAPPLQCLIAPTDFGVRLLEQADPEFWVPGSNG